MDGINQTYSYEHGADRKYRVIHRKDGEVVATIEADSPASDLEVALKHWVLSPALRKTVEGWLKGTKPKAVKTPKTTKTKRTSTRGGPVTVSRID